MARPPKPKALHVLEGTLRPSRHGDRHDVLAGGELVCPDWLSDDAKTLWGRITGRYPDGTLSDLDTAALTMLCHSFDRWQAYATSDEGDEYKRATMAAMFAKQFTSLASRFGMTPSDRAKLSIGGKQQTAEELRFFGSA